MSRAVRGLDRLSDLDELLAESPDGQHRVSLCPKDGTRTYPISKYTYLESRLAPDQCGVVSTHVTEAPYALVAEAPVQFDDGAEPPIAHVLPSAAGGLLPFSIRQPVGSLDIT